MAKITDGDDLNVGTEITIDTSGKTFTLVATGNLVAKDGVTLQALYSKFIKLWETSSYNKYPFPMYAIDALSGQFQFGTDGGSYNGWKPANDTTRQTPRDGGWTEYTSGGVVDRTYAGIVALAVTGEYLSVPASVGFIALLGIAVLNGVVMVSYFNQLRALGMPVERVVVEGARRRLRPVMMTASIAAFGLVPLLFATGPGSEIQRPLAVVVIGGLVSSTLLTLVLLPVLYRRFGFETAAVLPAGGPRG
jgi:hypothetical protein